jgi:hypothetical protein
MQGGYEFVAVLDPSGSFGAARPPLASSGRGGAPSAHVLRIGLRPMLPLYFAAGAPPHPLPAKHPGTPTHPTPSARRAHSVRWPRGVGDPRSEVKEEGWAKPGPGDMSGGGHPPRVAREVLAHTRTGARPKLESGTGGMRCSS